MPERQGAQALPLWMGCVVVPDGVREGGVAVASRVAASSVPGFASRRLPVATTAHVDRLIAGDGAAYEELVRRYGPRMQAVAGRYVRGIHDAEDVVQDALVNVVRSIANFKGESSLETWLHRIVVNCALMRLRHRRRKPHVPFDESQLDGEAESPCRRSPTPSAHDVVVRAETNLIVQATIARLPLRQRHILRLRDVQALETRQVAELLDVGVSTVKSELHRARRRVQGALAPGRLHEVREIVAELGSRAAFALHVPRPMTPQAI